MEASAMNKAALAPQTQNASLTPASLIPPRQGILQRKCACGNHTSMGGQCDKCAAKKGVLQRKLMIGASNDPLELEADRVADQVMSTPLTSAIDRTPPKIQRLTGQTSDGLNTAPPSVERVLASPGRPLEPALRQDMEQRFGHDFSQVRVHTGSAAELSAREVNANAYTVGQDIVFGAGQDNPESSTGMRLLAHELTHVVQQSRGGAVVATGRSQCVWEQEANHISSSIIYGNSSVQVSGASAPILARQSLTDLIQEFGPEVTQELITFWQGKIVQENDPSRRARYQRYVANLQNGAPLSSAEAGLKSEEEMRYFYRKIGPANEAAYKYGSSRPRGGLASKGATKPDIALTVGDIEVKARDVTDPQNARVVIREIRRQVAERQSGGRAHARRQGVILDLRGQNVTEAQIESVVSRLTTPAQVSIPGESSPVTVSVARQNIQIVINRGQLPTYGPGAVSYPLTAPAKSTAPTPLPSTGTPGSQAGGVQPPPNSDIGNTQLPSTTNEVLPNVNPAPNANAPANAKSAAVKPMNTVPEVVLEDALSTKTKLASRSSVQHTGRAFRFGMSAAKILGPMILDMANRYFMAKKEFARASAAIESTIDSNGVTSEIETLIERNRLDIARRQHRGSTVYATVAVTVTFTNDVMDRLTLRSVNLSHADESNFTSSVMSHDGLGIAEGKVWWIETSLPLDKVEVSKSEVTQFDLDELDDTTSKSSMDPVALGRVNQQRNALLERKQRELAEETAEKKRQIESPAVLPDMKKRTQQQQAIVDELQKMKSAVVPAPASKNQGSSLPASGSFFPPVQQQQPAGPSLFGSNEGSIEIAVKKVKEAKSWALRLEKKGSDLRSRLFGSNPPSLAER